MRDSHYVDNIDLYEERVVLFQLAAIEDALEVWIRWRRAVPGREPPRLRSSKLGLGSDILHLYL